MASNWLLCGGVPIRSAFYCRWTNAESMRRSPHMIRLKSIDWFTPLVVAAMTTFTLFSSRADAAYDDGFKSIFDGKTLDGWKAADMSFWSIEHGAITGKITPEHPLKDNLYLIWQGGDLAD